MKHWTQLLVFLFIYNISFGQISVNESSLTEIDIENWLNSLDSKSSFEFKKNILSFPPGTISQSVWNKAISNVLQSENPSYKLATAFQIGNKKIYPASSIGYLIEMLNDPSDSLANVAIFSLAAFGYNSISPLFQVIKEERKPFISDELEDTSSDCSNCKEFYYSRSAMRAMFALRIIGDTVLYELPKNHEIKGIYKAYLLQGIEISQVNFPLYLSELKKIKYLFGDYYKDFVENEYIFKKLRNYSLAEVSGILGSKNSTLFVKYNKYRLANIEDFNYPITSSEIVHQVENPPSSNSESIRFLEKINNIALYKNRFYEVQDTLIELLGNLPDVRDIEQVDFYKRLLVLISNIGDSAKVLEPYLQKYVNYNIDNILSTLDKSDTLDEIGISYEEYQANLIRYLAFKAILNVKMESNGGFIIYPPKLLHYPPSDTRYSVYPYSDYSYFILSDELNEGFPLNNLNEIATARNLEGYTNYPFSKIYFDSQRKIIKSNTRTIDLKDPFVVDYLLKYCNHPDKRYRIYVAYALGLSDTLPPSIKRVIENLLDDSIPEIRNTAALSALQLAVSDASIRRFLTIYFLEDYFNKRLESEKNELLYDIDHPPFVLGKGGFNEILPQLTILPKPSTEAVLIFEKFVPSTLYQAYNKIKQELFLNGMSDIKVYSYSDGFALLTRLERLSNDGSLDVFNRWNKNKLKPNSIGEYFCQVFFGDRSTFRSAAFIVCGKSNLGPYNRALINDNEYVRLFDEGAIELTPQIGNSKFLNKVVHLLIYQFSKNADGSIDFKNSAESNSIKSHLESFKFKSIKLK